MRTDPLVTPDWLGERLDAPDMRVIDATWFLPNDPRDAKALFEERRIPGAIFFDIDDIADADTALPHMLPSPEKFAARMRRLGVGDGSRIVIYDNHGVFSAARVWWTFRVMGHEDVAVLDGGFPAWERAGLPLETGAPALRKERHFTAQMRRDLVRGLPEMRRAVVNRDVSVLDARPAARFRGQAPEPRPNLRGGHMPGALNVPASELVRSDGTFKSIEDLHTLLSESAAPSIVCTCGSGITAAILALAFARLGRWDVSVYDGSWAEWGALPDTPVETATS